MSAKPLSVTAVERLSPNSENDTPTVANGTTIVAIDNKIEQAMDLVKTHLLYAVREEVEVLKERIIELEAKIARLETENKLLRKHAPVEVVQFIQQQQDQEQKPLSASPSDNTASPVVSTAPLQVFNVLQSQLQQPAPNAVK